MSAIYTEFICFRTMQRKGWKACYAIAQMPIGKGGASKRGRGVTAPAILPAHNKNE